VKGFAMQNITDYGADWRSVHTYEPMTLDKRPQDPNRDGAGLRFETAEHGYDGCPEAIVLTDPDGRQCTYIVEQQFSETSNRPSDPSGDGKNLKIETREHGGEYPDDMPQALRVSDDQGRVALYRPTMEDGKVVDSKGFCLEGPGSAFKCELDEAAGAGVSASPGPRAAP
jgi:hypothetical protein